MSNENQHWVPKFLIRHFADKDGRVFCLDIHTNEVTKRPPRLADKRELNALQQDPPRRRNRSHPGA
jgi:hypothetical protein